MAEFKHGDEVRYRIYDFGIASGILLDRAPDPGCWWVHTDDPRVYDVVRVHQSGRDAGRVFYRGRFDALGKSIPSPRRSTESA